MAGSAGRSGKVARGQRSPVHAGPVLSELSGLDLILGHVLRAGMAPRARFRKVQRVYRRLGVLHRADVMHAVAIDAGGHGVVARSQAFAVHAGLILGELIDPLLRPELAHRFGVAVAGGAELGNRGARDVALKALLGAHGNFIIVRVAIAAVAVRASQSRLGMNVVRVLLGRRLESGIEAGWHVRQESAANPCASNSQGKSSSRDVPVLLIASTPMRKMWPGKPAGPLPRRSPVWFAPCPPGPTPRMAKPPTTMPAVQTRRVRAARLRSSRHGSESV